MTVDTKRRVIALHVTIDRNVVTAIALMKHITHSHKFIERRNRDEYIIYSSCKYTRKFSKVIINKYIDYVLGLIKVNAKTNEHTRYIGQVHFASNKRD